MQKKGMIMKELWGKNKVRYTITALHILLTFLWPDRVLKNIGNIAIGTKAMDETISRELENVMAYVFSELFAILFVFLFWKLFFYVVNHFKKIYVVFLALFFVGSVVLLLAWPGIFTQSIDNLITYSSAVRLTPDYWHNPYSSFVYAGCLLFFPADFMITIMQWGFFVFVAAYYYERIQRVAPKCRFLVFLLFLLPDTRLVIKDSYRIYQYTIAILIYAGLVLFDVIEKKERGLGQTVAIAALGAFLAIWRSEGILFSTALFLAYVIGAGGSSWKKKLRNILLFVVCFGVLSFPQKVGEIKYYGRDYQIVNSFKPLSILLNDPETCLDYDTAQEDLDAIDQILPLGIIREYGLAGYLRYNYNVRGNMDFNQSLATKEESAAYLSAYFSILSHNLPCVAKQAWDNLFYTTVGRHVFFWQTAVPPEEHVDLAPYGMELWDQSSLDFYYNGHTAFISNITSQLQVTDFLNRVHTSYSDTVFRINGYLIFYFVSCVFHLCVFVRGLICLFRRKDLTAAGFGLVSVSMLCGYVALLLVMPTPSNVYLLISYYLSLAIACCLLVSHFARKTSHGGEAVA